MVEPIRFPKPFRQHVEGGEQAASHQMPGVEAALWMLPGQFKGSGETPVQQETSGESDYERRRLREILTQVDIEFRGIYADIDSILERVKRLGLYAKQLEQLPSRK